MTAKTIVLSIAGGFLHSTSPAGLNLSASHFKRVFDDGTQERHRWQLEIPGNFSASPKLFPTFAMTSATSGSVVVGGRIISVGSGVDIDGAGFDADNTTTLGIPGTAGHSSRPEIDLTSSCTMAASDNALIEFFRDGGDGSDTATGDLELIGLSFTYE